ncbi:MAG: carboxymuconolactone decarboxylase family protein [Aestuariivirga sp.]|nr:carboxymuconolactone decarboxylase family protein [Aestuariivirga sp.]
MKNSIRFSLFAIGFSLAAVTGPGFAEDLTPSQAATYKEIESMFGKVPEFIKKFPKAGIVGAWEEAKSLEFSDKTALPPKVKSLIAIAVAAQIPCEYCVYSDTLAAKQAGATDEEIAEAVGMAALTRHWSTVFHGLQIDLAQFKKDVGGQ